MDGCRISDHVYDRNGTQDCTTRFSPSCCVMGVLAAACSAATHALHMWYSTSNFHGANYDGPNKISAHGGYSDDDSAISSGSSSSLDGVFSSGVDVEDMHPRSFVFSQDRWGQDALAFSSAPGLQLRPSGAHRPSAPEPWEVPPPVAGRICETGMRLVARNFEESCGFALALAFPQQEDMELCGECVVSLVDRVSQARLELPCRGYACKHLEAFELSSYAAVNKTELTDPDVVETPR
jgi:hypothetical protein